MGNFSFATGLEERFFKCSANLSFCTFGDEQEHVSRDVEVLPGTGPLVLGILGGRTGQEAEALGDRLPDQKLRTLSTAIKFSSKF